MQNMWEFRFSAMTTHWQPFYSNQWGLNVSSRNWKWSCGLMVKTLKGSLIGSNSKFVPYVENFLIDSWEENKRDKQFKFLRKSVSLSRLFHSRKVTCENCGTQTTKVSLARHKKTCSVGTLFCTQCPSFATKFQNVLIYHIAKKHSAPKLEATFKCRLCYHEFPRYYALRQHKSTQEDFPIETANVDPDDIITEVDDTDLQEE